jgi:ferritin-like metal-binding protein YciE
MPLASLKDLYAETLQDLHSVEDQLVRALPKFAAAAAAPELRAAFARHAVVTEAQSERLGLLLAELGAKPAGKCRAMAGLIAEATAEAKKATHPAVLDLALIGNALQVEHYEIVAYECARTYARRLGYKQAVSLLGQSLEEEEEEEERLNLMAQAVILFEAEAAPPRGTSKAAPRKGQAKVKPAPNRRSR